MLVSSVQQCDSVIYTWQKHTWASALCFHVSLSSRGLHSFSFMPAYSVPQGIWLLMDPKPRMSELPLPSVIFLKFQGKKNPEGCWPGLGQILTPVSIVVGYVMDFSKMPTSWSPESALHGKRNLIDVTKLRILKERDYLGLCAWRQYNHKGP